MLKVLKILRSDVADDIAKFTRCFRWYCRYLVDDDVDGRAQSRLETRRDRLLQCVFERGCCNNQHACLLHGFLDDFKKLNLRKITQDVNERQAMHDGAVVGHDEISAAPFDFF